MYAPSKGCRGRSLRCSDAVMQMESGSEGGSELSVKAACCACLTELVVNDANGQQTVQNNGIYRLASLLVQPMSTRGTCRPPTAEAGDLPDAATVQLQVTIHDWLFYDLIHCIVLHLWSVA